MNLTLTRYRHKEHYIDGYLSNKDGRLCATLENAQHCLPTGTYHIIIAKCHQHARKMPVIQLMNNSWAIHGNSCSKETPCDSCEKLPFVCNNTTMPCYCPQLTPGNGAYNRTDGAILVGEYNCSGSLIHPKDVFDRIYQILRKSDERGHEISLTIKEGTL